MELASQLLLFLQLIAYGYKNLSKHGYLFIFCVIYHFVSHFCNHKAEPSLPLPVIHHMIVTLILVRHWISCNRNDIQTFLNNSVLIVKICLSTVAWVVHSNTHSQVRFIYHHLLSSLYYLIIVYRLVHFDNDLQSYTYMPSQQKCL